MVAHCFDYRDHGLNSGGGEHYSSFAFEWCKMLTFNSHDKRVNIKYPHSGFLKPIVPSAVVLDKKKLSWFFFNFFSTGTYAGIGTKCVESENIMKSTHTKKSVLSMAVRCHHISDYLDVYQWLSYLCQGTEGN